MLRIMWHKSRKTQRLDTEKQNMRSHWPYQPYTCVVQAGTVTALRLVFHICVREDVFLCGWEREGERKREKGVALPPFHLRCVERLSAKGETQQPWLPLRVKFHAGRNSWRPSLTAASALKPAEVINAEHCVILSSGLSGDHFDCVNWSSLLFVACDVCKHHMMFIWN